MDFPKILFEYPSHAHARKHGPDGYSDYSSFKPWLRDDFSFRCTYCLFRERWYPNGHHSFGVDHLLAKSTNEEVSCTYDNLFYACNLCNTAKGTYPIPINPCSEALGKQIKMSSNGALEATTPAGQDFIDLFGLNDEKALDERGRIISLLSDLAETERLMDHVLFYLSFPDDLPALHNLNPTTNSRPEGLGNSYSRQKEKGILPQWY